MDAYATWGVDLAIDLEHQMLEPAIAPDPTAKDARGWCRLELREDGSLWAVNVSWTADGRARLTEKRQRYVSPAFSVDPETSRVVAIINVAITAIPATHDTPALVAAARAGTNNEFTAKLAAGKNSMTLEEFLKVIKALGLDPTMSLEEAMAKIRGEAPVEAEPDPNDPAEPAEVAAGEPSETMTNAAEPPPSSDEDTATVAAAISRLTRTTGKSTIGEAVEEVELWRSSHVKLEAETKRLAAEREVLELAKRKENASKLVQLGAETPHTSGLAKGKLAKRLLDEPLADQIARIEALTAARGGKVPALPVPPVAVNAGAPADGTSQTFQVGNQTIELSAKELAMCSAKKTDPAKYAATRVAMLARSHTSTNGADR